MSDDPYAAGYRTIEELAQETQYAVGTVRNIAKQLGLPQTVLAGHHRQRFSPEDAQKIRDEAQRRHKQGGRSSNP